MSDDKKDASGLDDLWVDLSQRIEQRVARAQQMPRRSERIPLEGKGHFALSATTASSRVDDGDES
jgi:hypothetical protein